MSITHYKFSTGFDSFWRVDVSISLNLVLIWFLLWRVDVSITLSLVLDLVYFAAHKFPQGSESSSHNAIFYFHIPLWCLWSELYFISQSPIPPLRQSMSTCYRHVCMILPYFHSPFLNCQMMSTLLPSYVYDPTLFPYHYLSPSPPLAALYLYNCTFKCVWSDLLSLSLFPPHPTPCASILV